MRPRTFLATTAREDFWDVSKPILFLSEGCRLYGRRAFWEPLGGRVLESPWRSVPETHAAYEFVGGIHKKVLESLASALNAAHGCRHDLRYWRILLGPWLNWYLHAAYDRYRLIRTALDAEPNLTTVGLAESCFVTPRDTLDFLMLVLDDAYNLQLCTKILAALGLDFPRQEARRASTPLPAEKGGGPPSVASLKSLARNFYQAALVSGQEGRPVLLKTAYFSRRAQIGLALKTGGRTWISAAPPLDPLPESGPAGTKRRSGLCQSLGEDEFDRILSRLISEDLPRCFVEEYGRVQDHAQTHYPKAPRAILSANGWYCDEAFQHWAGTCAEEGTLLLGTQHGGCYGTQRDMIHLDHELAITDRYYTWGWERAGARAETLPMPGSKLTGLAPLPADNRRTGILFVMTVAPRFLIEFPYASDFFHDYLAEQQIFVEALDPILRDAMRARPHRHDYGWDVAQRWKDRFPGIALETWKTPLRKSLADCRLFVADHASTTYLEALAAGKPTLLFWAPGTAVNKLHPDAQEYFDDLRGVGILHDTPQAAAKAVGEAYWDVEAWWNEPARRAAVERFRRRFAFAPKNALSLWAKELDRAAAEPRTNPF